MLYLPFLFQDYENTGSCMSKVRIHDFEKKNTLESQTLEMIQVKVYASVMYVAP